MTEEQPKKLDIDSRDIMGENLEKLKEMFPSVVKDGTVDVEALRNVIGDISEPNQEYYNFTWAGKSEAFKIIKEKTTATLKPLKSDDESVDFENTENIFIEGDNLEVLKILQKTYHNSIKMIYIDPPYNKDKDFVYPDKWSEGLTSYLEYSKLVDEEGNITSSSAEDKSVKAGRKHSRWLTMMYPRLFLARNLLKDDGVIFISIDDDEFKNLKIICDEIFGEENFIEVLKWKKKKQPSFLAKHTAKVMEYILIYSKNKDNLEKLSIEGTSDSTKKVVNNSNNLSTRHFDKGVRVKLDGDGKLLAGEYQIKTMTIEYLQDVNYVNGYTTNPVDVKARFSVSQEKIDSFIENDLLFITSNKGLRRDVSEEEIGKRKSITDLCLQAWGDNQESDNEMRILFDTTEYFDYTKPTLLIKNLIKSIFSENEIILDFFAGSGTTAHAVMSLNALDGGNRKSISVQLPEHLDRKESIEAINFLNSIYKPTNIAEITKERMRRARTNILTENQGGTIDTGFKVFKLSESNFKQWDDTPKSKVELQLAFEEYKDNVKEGANQLDMLYEVILAKGLSLNSKVQEIEVGCKKMFSVKSDGVELLACFENEITESALDEVIELRPIYFICLDSSFKSGSALKTNSVLRFRDADILFETV